ncbi:Mitosis inhibitor protein kinase wee1 [Elsinoe australis]|uniref:Mitosis inhibitor protein kinase wee1 n=1 Tax=Elsinoe australis TaxID=40998 RepID=A0A2P8ABN3_9PEZI|nr:Mitosis inhibitor protein kinase wee1 [Elsinoe australis]
MIVWMLSPDPRTVTSLETFLARSFAASLLLVAFLNLLFSGELQAIFAEAGAADVNSPYASPTLYATLIYNTASCIMLYTYSYSHSLSSSWLTIGSVLHLILASSGLLLIMFGQGPGHISKRTGADKRTSGFPFKNAESDRKKR